MQRQTKWFLRTMSLCLMGVASVHAAGPWYVATNGVDDAGRDGLSWAQSWLTISNAVAQATTGTIYVSNGVYSLGKQITVTKALTLEGINGRDHTIVDGNDAVRCFHVNHKDAILRGLTITNGYSIGTWDLGNGGGVRLLSGKLDNCLIVDNLADFKGGGIYVGYGADVSGGNDNPVVTNCIVRGNRAVHGGGISLWGASAKYYHLTVDASEIVSNFATRGGGGIYFQGNTLTVRNSLIAYNEVSATAGGNVGGGVFVDTPITQTLIENTQISDNIISNSLAIYGAGISLMGSPNRLKNCLIARNRADYRNNGSGGVRGGGLYVGTVGATNSIESCTFVGNFARSQWYEPLPAPTPGGSAIYFLGNGQDVVTNCIVYGNLNLPDWFFGDQDRTNRVHYTCSPLPMGGIGNIVGDPQYIDPAAGNYRLRGTSPCLNVGQTIAWMNTAQDLDGNPRIDRIVGIPDMGCYEHVYAGTLLQVR